MKKMSRQRMEEIVEKFLGSSKFASAWRHKWRTQKDNASRREIEHSLTFKEYLRLARRAKLSRPEDVGVKGNRYVLARLGDTGPYSFDNCRFITNSANLKEGRRNGCHLESDAAKRTYTKYNNAGVASAASKLTGRTKFTDPSLRARGLKRKGKTKEDTEFIARMAYKNSKDFRLKSPSGKVYKGRNLNEFCKKHGLNQGNLAAVCRGDRPHCGGWTGYYC